MTTLRSITTLRSLLSATKCYRMDFSFRRIPFQITPAMFSCANNSMRTEQICWFSSSTVVHARRRDRTDATATEDLDNEEEEKDDDEDVDSEQVRWRFFNEVMKPLLNYRQIHFIIE